MNTKFNQKNEALSAQIQELLFSFKVFEDNPLSEDYLAEHFKVPGMLCINKFDLNQDTTKSLEDIARKKNIPTIPNPTIARVVPMPSPWSFRYPMITSVCENKAISITRNNMSRSITLSVTMVPKPF